MKTNNFLESTVFSHKFHPEPGMLQTGWGKEVKLFKTDILNAPLADVFISNIDPKPLADHIVQKDQQLQAMQEENKVLQEQLRKLTEQNQRSTMVNTSTEADNGMDGIFQTFEKDFQTDAVPVQEHSMQTSRQRVRLTSEVKQQMKESILQSLARLLNREFNEVSLDIIPTISSQIRKSLTNTLDRQTQNYLFRHLLPELSRSQLARQNSAEETQQRIKMLETMLGSTLQGHTFKDGAKHAAAEFAVRKGWIWSQSNHTYEKRLDQQTLARGADKLYVELTGTGLPNWFIN